MPMVLLAYTDAGLNRFCWRVAREDGVTIDSGTQEAIGESMYLEALALAYVLARLAGMGYGGARIHWFTDAKPIVDVLLGRVRPRKPGMQWIVGQVTWLAHRHGFIIEPEYCPGCFDC